MNNQSLPKASRYRLFAFGFAAIFVIIVVLALMISPIIAIHPAFGAFIAIVIIIYCLSSIANNVYNKKYEPLDKAKYSSVYRLTGEVCAAAGIPVPELAITDDAYLNVMTLGFSPKSAKIIFTKLFLDNLKLTDTELKSVIAHEVGHIVHKDYILASILSFITFFIFAFGTFLKNISLNALRWGKKNAHWLIGPVLAFVGIFLAMAYIFRKNTVTYIIALLIMFIVVLFIIGLIIFAIFILTIIGLIIIGAALICSFFVNQFSKQCEYAADSFARDLMGSSTPLSTALITIEVFNDELNLRKNEWVKQNPNLSLRNLPVRSLIQSIKVPPVDVKKYRSKRQITTAMLFNEFFFATHPLIKHRVDMVEKTAPASLPKQPPAVVTHNDVVERFMSGVNRSIVPLVNPVFTSLGNIAESIFGSRIFSPATEIQVFEQEGTVKNLDKRQIQWEIDVMSKGYSLFGPSIQHGKQFIPIDQYAFLLEFVDNNQIVQKQVVYIGEMGGSMLNGDGIRIKGVDDKGTIRAFSIYDLKRDAWLVS